jgi:hypothetical protein
MTQSTYPASRRAAVLCDFGEANNFSVREVPTPALRPDEMLVRSEGDEHQFDRMEQSERFLL